VNRFKFVTQRQLDAVVERLQERIDGMASQEDVDAVVAALQDDEAGLQAVDTKITDAATKLQAELDNLQAQINAGQPLDLSALQSIPAELSAVSDALGTHVDAVGALTPTPPAGS
jgi:hypothetical protein